jgi:hypothetical protein
MSKKGANLTPLQKLKTKTSKKKEASAKQKQKPNPKPKTGSSIVRAGKEEEVMREFFKKLGDHLAMVNPEDYEAEIEADVESFAGVPLAPGGRKAFFGLLEGPSRTQQPDFSNVPVSFVPRFIELYLAQDTQTAKQFLDSFFKTRDMRAELARQEEEAEDLARVAKKEARKHTGQKKAAQDREDKRAAKEQMDAMFGEDSDEDTDEEAFDEDAFVADLEEQMEQDDNAGIHRLYGTLEQQAETLRFLPTIEEKLQALETTTAAIARDLINLLPEDEGKELAEAFKAAKAPKTKNKYRIVDGQPLIVDGKRVEVIDRPKERSLIHIPLEDKEKLKIINELSDKQLGRAMRKLPNVEKADFYTCIEPDAEGSIKQKAEAFAALPKSQLACIFRELPESRQLSLVNSLGYQEQKEAFGEKTADALGGSTTVIAGRHLYLAPTEGDMEEYNILEPYILPDHTITREGQTWYAASEAFQTILGAVLQADVKEGRPPPQLGNGNPIRLRTPSGDELTVRTLYDKSSRGHAPYIKDRANLYKRPPWINARVSGVYVMPKSEGVENYHLGEATIIDGEKWYRARAELFELLQDAGAKTRVQEGETLTIFMADGSSVSFAIGYDTNKGFVRQDEEMFQDEKEYMRKRRLSRQQELVEIRTEPVTTEIRDLGRRYLSDALLAVAPDRQEYTFMHDYVREAVATIANSSKDVGEFANTLGQIIVLLRPEARAHFGDPFGESSVFVTRVASGYYDPEMLALTDMVTRAPEIYDAGRSREETKKYESVLNGLIKNFVDAFLYKVYNDRKFTQVAAPEAEIEVLDLSVLCENSDTVQDVPKENLVYYPENGKIYCFVSSDIIDRVQEGDTTNPVTGMELEEAFVKKFTVSPATDQAPTAAPERKPVVVLAPGLIERAITNIDMMKAELRQREEGEDNASVASDISDASVVSEISYPDPQVTDKPAVPDPDLGYTPEVASTPPSPSSTPAPLEQPELDPQEVAFSARRAGESKEDHRKRVMDDLFGSDSDDGGMSFGSEASSPASSYGQANMCNHCNKPMSKPRFSTLVRKKGGYEERVFCSQECLAKKGGWSM